MGWVKEKTGRRTESTTPQSMEGVKVQRVIGKPCGRGRRKDVAGDDGTAAALLTVLSRCGSVRQHSVWREVGPFLPFW